MTLAQLRYTIAIAKAGSMNEAAKSLYISQPSLSTAIRELEAETGVEIFRRTNRGIAVTPAVWMQAAKLRMRMATAL